MGTSKKDSRNEAGREFYLADVLSVVTGRTICAEPIEGLSDGQMDGVMGILNFLMGRNVLIHEIPQILPFCKECLVGLYPQLDPTGELTHEFGKMVLALENLEVQADSAKYLLGWTSQVERVTGLGRKVPIRALP